MVQDPLAEHIKRQYTIALVLLAVLTIVFQPAFHYILALLPDRPPDSLRLRLVSAGVAAMVLLLVLLVPSARRFSAWLQVLNAATALIVVHQLVFDSGNHPMYLAASLTALYGAQLAFVRLREWVITVALVAGFYVVAALWQRAFAPPGGLIAPLFYSANYVITTALVWGRERLLRDDLQRRFALEHANLELSAVTQRLQNELDLAREIQQSLLPPVSPGWTRFDVHCYSRAAREVGGDFYSYYAWDEGHVALVVGDVSGKGASAALLMATSLSLLNASFARRGQAALRLVRLDHQLLPYTGPRDQNCALSYIEIDGQQLTIINAGGIAPYLRRSNGTVEWPEVWGFPLGQGLSPREGYLVAQRWLQPGDMVVLVSDGVVETRNARGDLFSFGRLEQALVSGPGHSARAMVEYLVRRLRKFAGRIEPPDDVTIAVLRVV
ncbi:PP2C family protein-serine/threonine phosphatase [Kallotenue papyrolyticum]|uniref:PP2C family protein-serine/threonine phosphatase n=1 Tax=Kallotenue papyrolyticum TaxID=1325125 RepID=UPI000492AAE2|nr:PP2C family protein-serine/threonine phosphatase [Kallotenue papyrolyticum]